jgi:diguanylate cyclase (GGDEF)-like protein
MLKTLRDVVEPRTKRDALRFVAIYTAFALSFSLTVDYLFILKVGTGQTSMLTAAVVIPLLLAPPMTWFSAKATLRIQEMKLELERLVRIDPLSGALNRRGLEEFAERAFKERQASGTLSALIMDIDCFKAINDTYGHAAGDAIIAQVVRITKEGLGTENVVVGRLGGDELLVYFAGCSLEETMMMAERLRDMIQHMVFVHGDRRIMITTSIGVAATDPLDSNVEPMLKRADQSLYAAKSAGRNRVRAAA